VLLAPRAARRRTEAARAVGFVRRQAAGRDFPVLIATEGGAAAGILVDGIGPRTRFRLRRYERGYLLRSIEAIGERSGAVAALAFLPTERLPADQADWNEAGWRRGQGGRVARAILRRRKRRTA